MEAYDYSETVAYLLDWYEQNARILPWREDPKPYYVWISEIMLQQTRVETVKTYFERFIKEFPTLRDLADAPEDKLLKMWEGLGYYNRAKNLQKTAQLVFEVFDGELPSDHNRLRALPGIGTYTARAISSIAFQNPVAAIDGNVLRVMKRAAGSYDNVMKEKVRRELEEELTRIIPKDRPGDFNQAVMELGALVCLPNGRPLCESCPLMHLCKAFHQGIQMKLPVKDEKKPRKIEERTIYILEYNKRFALHKRPEKGLLAGMWELPGAEGRGTIRDVKNWIRDQQDKDSSDKVIFNIEDFGVYRHVFTHIEWHMTGYYVTLAKPVGDFIYVDADEIEKKYAVPSAFAPFMQRIMETRLQNPTEDQR